MIRAHADHLAGIGREHARGARVDRGVDDGEVLSGRCREEQDEEDESHFGAWVGGGVESLGGSGRGFRS